MHVILAILLFLQGLSHFVSFLEYWKVINAESIRYHSTAYPMSLTATEITHRILGLLFLLTGILFLFLGYDLLTGMHIFWSLIWRALIASLVISVISYPKSKIGLITDILLLVLLFVNEYYFWVQ